MTLEAMLSAYHDAWNNRHETPGKPVPMRFNKGESVDTLHALADRMLKAFLASPLAQPKGVIISIEEELRVVLDPALPEVLAKVDLVTQTHGSLHIVDFKTSRSRWSEQKAQESADQLLLYGQTVARMSRSLGLPVKLHFAVLTKHKKPQVQLIPIAVDGDRFHAIRDSIKQVWEAIRAGNFYPSPSPMNCAGCPFKSRCPVFAGVR